MAKSKSAESSFDLLLAVVAGLPLLVFHRWYPDAFDLPKAVVSIVGGFFLFAFGLMTKRGRRFGDVKFQVLGFVTIGALVSSALQNPNFDLALHGNERRYTGLVLWTASIFAMLSARYFSTKKTSVYFLWTLFLASWPFNLYAFLQATGNDPFQWSITSFSSTIVFSTQGNPNFASWTCFLFVAGGLWLLADARNQTTKVLASTSIAWTVVNLTLTSSLQGQIAVVALCLVIIGIGVVGRNSSAWKHFFPSAIVLFLVVATYLTRNWSYSHYYWLIGGTFALYLSPRLLARLNLLRIRTSAGGVSAALIAVGIAFLVSTPTWFSGQVGERAAFYRAGWSMFSTNPLLGVGLERYGRLFAFHRPLWHARELPTSLSSSAHSMWLGIMVAGGLILLLPILAIATISILRSARSALSAGASSEASVLTALCVASAVVWLFAVEQPSTIFVTMLIFGLGASSGNSSTATTRKPRPSRLQLVPVVLAPILLLGSIVYSIRVSLGNRAQVEAYAAIFDRQDVSEGIDLLNRAVDYGPTSSEATAIRGNLFAQLGMREDAIRDAVSAAEKFEYSGQTPVASAEVLIAFEEYDEAKRILLEAIRLNPGFTSVQDDAARLLASIASSTPAP